jgi:rhodanese-related sulfurtransferase
MEHFMPNAALLLLKLIVDRKSRRLLGVQATGKGNADKRVDVASMAIRARMTVDELASADLCYAPQYSPAMDNLITAANVARNKLDGHLPGIPPAEVYRMLKNREDFLFLDVRTPEEYEEDRLPHATPIPLGSLRGRLAELPPDKPIVAFCDISLRAYEAALILRHAGFTQVRVMDGGMAMWPYERVE